VESKSYLLIKKNSLVKVPELRLEPNHFYA